MEGQDSIHVVTRHFRDQIGFKGQIYNLFEFIPLDRIKKQIRKAKQKIEFVTLFSDENSPFPSIFGLNSQKSNIEIVRAKDLNLQKVLQNTKQKKSLSLSSENSSMSEKNEFYCFGYDSVIAFHQTPNFKKSLYSSFVQFIESNINRIMQLSLICRGKQKIKQVQLKENPLEFKQRSGAYFMGLALNMRNNGVLFEALFFYELAVYVEPFNYKNWGEFIDLLKKIGMWRKAAMMAKAGFLFNSISCLAQDYLICGDKGGLQIYELRGLLGSLNDALKYEKVILESSRLEIKKRKIWRGFILLLKYCIQQDFKSNLSQYIMLISSVLCYLGFGEISMMVLNHATNKRLCKYQTFSLYFDEIMRLRKGKIPKSDRDFLEAKIKNLPPETRYRVYLDLADAVKRLPDKRNKYYLQALKTATNLCTEEVNRKRAYRHIYINIVSNFKMQPKQFIFELHPKDDHFRFLANKARFVKGECLIQYNFNDWKYYLHFSLEKNLQILKKCYLESRQGRVLAEYIHVIRLIRKPLAVLKLWREKIEQSPKSGQLWCQGGRIFMELRQYSNAKKCLLAAIHFTPQYGDSFLELSKVLMIENNFLELNQLRKNFIVSQPFYGNVFSFLRLSLIDSKNSYAKLSLWQKIRNIFSEIWNLNKENIQRYLYDAKQDVYQISSQNKESETFGRKVILTVCSDYDRQFQNPCLEKERQRLFMSYQLIENKFFK